MYKVIGFRVTDSLLVQSEGQVFSGVSFVSAPLY